MKTHLTHYVTFHFVNDLKYRLKTTANLARKLQQTAIGITMILPTGIFSEVTAVTTEAIPAVEEFAVVDPVEVLPNGHAVDHEQMQAIKSGDFTKIQVDTFFKNDVHG